MTEPEALRQRRQHLLEQPSRTSDVIGTIDSRLYNILAGNRSQGGAGA